MNTFYLLTIESNENRIELNQIKWGEIKILQEDNKD